MKKCFLLFLKPREHNFFENISTFLPNWNIFFFVVENFRGTNFARKGTNWLIVPKLVSIGYPLRLGAKLLFFSQLKIVRSERDVVAVVRFSNFKSL